MRVIGEYEAARSGYGVRYRTAGRWHFAQKLAMRGIAEIELAVASTRGDDIGTGGNGLSFQGLEWSIRRGFGGDHRRNGSLSVHSDDRGQGSGGRLDL